MQREGGCRERLAADKVGGFPRRASGAFPGFGRPCALGALALFTGSVLTIPCLELPLRCHAAPPKCSVSSGNIA